MNIMTLFFVIIGFLFLILCIVIFLSLFDWKAFLIERFGSNYEKGLARMYVNGQWKSRYSDLIYKGHDAFTYIRYSDSGIPESDIVPNNIGFDYDEDTGRRIYRIVPGDAVATTDNPNIEKKPYPSANVSVHVFDRLGVSLSTSVTSEAEYNWKPILFGGIAVIIVIVLMFATGFLKLPGSVPKQADTKPQQTQTNPAPTENDNIKLVPVEVK